MKNNIVDGYARSLVQHAARKAPHSLAERLEEEWLADFEGRRSGMARLRFGIGCAWATRVIAHDYLEPKVATAAGGTVAARNYPATDYSFVSRRTVAVLGILGLHALIIYGFTTGLVHKVLVYVAPPFTVMPTPPKVIERPPPLEPNPILQKQIPLFPREAHVERFDDDNTPKEAAVIEPVQPPQIINTQPQPPAVKRVGGGPGRGFPNSGDFYPPAAIRGRIEGTAAVSVCTDERGRLTAAPTLVHGSGNADLDQAALRLAKAGSGRYRSSTEDGRPVSSCYPFNVTFNMRD
jgi:TonB family protein